VNTMTKWLCALLVMGAAIATAQDIDAELLDKYRKIYDDTTAEYETQFRMESQTWPINYIKALKALQTQFQTSGSLDGWEIVNQELTRFRAEPTLIDITSPIVELHDLQNTYRDHATQIKDNRDSKVDAFRGRYLTRLTTIQQNLTRKGRFDSAFAARDEIARVKPDEDEPEAPEENPQITKEEPNAELVPEKHIPPQNVVTQPDGTTITLPGDPPPDREGMNFRMKTLAKTTQSPWSALVSVKLYESTDKEKGNRSRGSKAEMA